jgi:hypothetical protein
MTCIAGIARGGTVWIGGDSAAVNPDWHLRVGAEPKVFRSGAFVVGYTSSFRMGQLLAHALCPPERPAGRDLMTYMVTDFVDTVRDCLKDGGFARAENGVESAGEFLVGIEGRLFCVETDYHVGESSDGLAACGCGEQAALGVLHALGERMAPERRIERALKIAERLSAGVRGPFTILSTGGRP